ncbi:hypothetical protein [Pigmentiphaga litoralis]|uniref:hypothetical protein n=1 Tax=Pigmentiphaga litoralis TaxID=516702 RepID=UPI003B42FFF3
MQGAKRGGEMAQGVGNVDSPCRVGQRTQRSQGFQLLPMQGRIGFERGVWRRIHHDLRESKHYRNL